MDPRITQLAHLFLDHSLQVKKGDKVVIMASDMSAIDTVRECYRLCLERDAPVHVDVHHISLYMSRADHGGLFQTFLDHASETALSQSAPLVREAIAWGDKFLMLTTLHNRSYLSRSDAAKIAKWRGVANEDFEPIVRKDRLVTYLPTLGAAQNAHMSLEDFTDYYYSAALIDYAALGARIKRVQDILDAGSVVRIKAKNTDLRLGIKGRLAAGAQTGRRNVPDGECFIAPEEGLTEGVVAFEYPQVKDGNEITGIRLRFEAGAVVEATAEQGEDYLLAALDDHPNNRRLGELGIGLNPNIQTYIRDTIFDEKIEGTFHIALGSAYHYERGGGPNHGSIHWDLVKDLRHAGSELSVDDEVLIRDGVVLI